jgi:hypothetical protein
MTRRPLLLRLRESGHLTFLPLLVPTPNQLPKEMALSDFSNKMYLSHIYHALVLIYAELRSDRSESGKTSDTKHIQETLDFLLRDYVTFAAKMDKTFGNNAEAVKSVSTEGEGVEPLRQMFPMQLHRTDLSRLPDKEQQ